MSLDAQAYGAGKDEEFMAEYISIDKTNKSRKEALRSGKWQQVNFDRNNSHASRRHHAKGDYPSVLHGPCTYIGTVNVRIKNLPKGTEGQIRCVYVDKNNATKTRCDIEEFVSSANDTFAKAAVSGFVPQGEKMRVEVIHFGNGNAAPTVIAGSVRLHVMETGGSTPPPHSGPHPGPHPVPHPRPRPEPHPEPPSGSHPEPHPGHHGGTHHGGPHVSPIHVSAVTYKRVKDSSLRKDILPHVFKIMGIDDGAAQKHWHDGIMTCASRESGYNLNAINAWDRNAHGPLQTDHHPLNCSRGIMQVIPPTFAANHQTGTSNNIYDGVANVCASMNYVMHRYHVSKDGHDLAAKVPQFNPNHKPQGY